MSKNRELLLSWSLWFLALFLLAGAIFFALGYFTPQSNSPIVESYQEPDPIEPQGESVEITIPSFISDNSQTSIYRAALVNTVFPDRGPRNATTYQVLSLDSVFGIAPDTTFSETLTVVAQDYCNADTLSFMVRTYFCGDCNADGVINSADVVCLIDYLFKGGSGPDPLEAGTTTVMGWSIVLMWFI